MAPGRRARAGVPAGVPPPPRGAGLLADERRGVHRLRRRLRQPRHHRLPDPLRARPGADADAGPAADGSPAADGHPAPTDLPPASHPPGVRGVSSQRRPRGRHVQQHGRPVRAGRGVEARRGARRRAGVPGRDGPRARPGGACAVRRHRGGGGPGRRRGRRPPGAGRSRPPRRHPHRPRPGGGPGVPGRPGAARGQPAGRDPAVGRRAVGRHGGRGARRGPRAGGFRRDALHHRRRGGCRPAFPGRAGRAPGARPVRRRSRRPGAPVRLPGGGARPCAPPWRREAGQ